MKILVIDDSATHRKTAEFLLKDHDLTIVSTHEEAVEALHEKVDEENLRRLLNNAGYPDRFNAYSKDVSEDERKKYQELYREYRKQSILPIYDVVLTDLLIPASDSKLGDKNQVAVGIEMPFGVILALFAIKQGVKSIAIVSDANHHDHPGVAATDCICGYMKTGETSLICLHDSVSWFHSETFEIFSDEFLYSPEGKQKYPQITQFNHAYGYNCIVGYEGCVRGKRWDTALKSLTEYQS